MILVVFVNLFIWGTFSVGSGMQRSVVTDTDRRMQNSRCAVCAVIKLRAGTRAGKTCESTREERTSVVTDTDRKMQK